MGFITTILHQHLGEYVFLPLSKHLKSLPKQGFVFPPGYSWWGLVATNRNTVDSKDAWEKYNVQAESMSVVQKKPAMSLMEAGGRTNYLGSGFNDFFNCHPYLGKILILTSIFFRWVEHNLGFV